MAYLVYGSTVAPVAFLVVVCRVSQGGTPAVSHPATGPDVRGAGVAGGAGGAGGVGGLRGAGGVGPILGIERGTVCVGLTLNRGSYWQVKLS